MSKPIVLLVALFVASIFHQDVPQLSSDTEKILQQILNQIRVNIFILKKGENQIGKMNEAHKAAVLFAKYLEDLERRVDEKLAAHMVEVGAKDISAKLITIAGDVKKNVDVYAEIKRQYITPERLLTRGRTSPHLQQAHATEKYRLAWEYYLLSPMPEGAVAAYESRAITALGKIGNVASIITVEHCYKITCEDQLLMDEPLGYRQKLLLGAFGWFPNNRSLHAMLECLALTKNQQVKSGPDAHKWDVEKHVFRLLTDQENYGNAAKWKEVINAFPRDKLPQEHLDLLDKVDKYFKGD